MPSKNKKTENRKEILKDKDIEEAEMKTHKSNKTTEAEKDFRSRGYELIVDNNKGDDMGVDNNTEHKHSISKHIVFKQNIPGEEIRKVLIRDIKASNEGKFNVKLNLGIGAITKKLFGILTKMDETKSDNYMEVGQKKIGPQMKANYAIKVGFLGDNKETEDNSEKVGWRTSNKEQPNKKNKSSWKKTNSEDESEDGHDSN